MNAIKLIAEALRERGFDGLVDDEYECGCLLDDLMPCCASENLSTCEPGYARFCSGCPRRAEGNCPIPDGPTGTFCVGKTKDYPEASDD